MTCRSWGVSNSYKIEKLNQLIRGWINYFKIASMKTLCVKMDSNIRYRLRMCIWKHWKTPQNRAKNLIKLGINKYTAWKVAYAGARIAYVCNKGVSYVKLIEPPCTERYARWCERSKVFMIYENFRLLDWDESIG